MLLREYIRIILEGYKEDQETLINKFPDNSSELKIMNPKIISWFIQRFGNNTKFQEIHPFEDCIDTVKRYDKKAAGLSQKYLTNEFFKDLVDKKFPNKKWSNLADYISMTVDEMEQIMGLSERKKPRFGIEGNEPDYSDFLGKFGPWNLWMPTTQENSVKIAGYDPETLEPKTTWCTARVTSSNLFYNYAGRGIILYYIIKDNPKSSTDWISVGFNLGELDLYGHYGGITVDRDNKGLTEENLKSIFMDQYERLMVVMQEKVDKLKGEHPAKKKIEEAAQSLSAYHNLIKGLGNEEKRDISQIILRQDIISPDVLKNIIQKFNDIDLRVLANENEQEDVLRILANSSDSQIRWNVAHNRNTPANVLENLVDDNRDIQIAVALHKNTSAHTLEKLADNKDKDVRFWVAKNINTSPDTLDKLSSDFSLRIIHAILQNRNTSLYTLEKLANDKNFDVRSSVVKHPNVSVQMLERFADDENELVRCDVAENKHTPDHILEKLASDKITMVRQSVAGNKHTPDHILEKLASDKATMVRQSVARNEHTPDYILEKIIKNNNYDPWTRADAAATLRSRNKHN